MDQQEINLALKVTALKSSVTDDHSRDVIIGAEFALEQIGNPLRLNFFSTAMRMLFEHLMDKLSPRDSVERCSWFKPETKGGAPSRMQRMLYAIHGGFSSEFVYDRFSIDSTRQAKILRDEIDNLAKQIHGREHTVYADLTEQGRLAEVILDAMTAFLESVRQFRDQVLSPIASALDDAAVEALLSETIQAIDELASHYFLNEIYVDQTVVFDIGPDSITYRSTGTVDVTLQWGSNSDRRRGDGAELDEAFPFQCDMVIPLDDAWNLEMAKVVAGVDTSEWRDAMGPDDLE